MRLMALVVLLYVSLDAGEIKFSFFPFWNPESRPEGIKPQPLLPSHCCCRHEWVFWPNPWGLKMSVSKVQIYDFFNNTRGDYKALPYNVIKHFPFVQESTIKAK